MQKDKAKVLMAAAGVPVAHGHAWSTGSTLRPRTRCWPPPLRAQARSTRDRRSGVIIVRERAQPSARRRSVGRTGRIDDLILAETFVAGRELTCAVIGDRALDVIDIVVEPPATSTTTTRNTPTGGSTHVLSGQS